MTDLTRTGTLQGLVPFTRIEGGKKVFVYFLPLNDAFQDFRTRADSLARFFRNYTKTHTLYVLGRRREMPKGFSLDDMVADYRKAVSQILKEENVKEIDLGGLSLGGILAAKFARKYPGKIHHLVLEGAGYKLSKEAAPMPDDMKPLIKKKKWLKLLSIFIDMTFERRKGLLKAMMIMGWLKLLIDPPPTNDLEVSVDAIRGLDIADDMKRIKVPTLVIGGNRDRFFTADILKETAKIIPGSQLYLIDGVGHGAIVEEKVKFEKKVLRFLQD